VADVLITFSFTIAPAAQGASLQPRDLAGSASVIAAIELGYAQLLRVPQARVRAANFTDLATGAIVAASPVPRVRRLAAAAAGSLGVSVSVVVALGKTPTEQETINYNTALSAAGAPAMAALQASITQAVASNARAPASAFSTGAPASVSFVGSPFISSTNTVVVVAASSPASVAPAAGGAAAGGITGAILLACAVWSYRSWSKHGELPCFRNRKREELFKKASAAESVEVTSAIAEAENALGGADAGPGMGGSSKALIVKRLVEKAARDSAKAKEAEAALAQLRDELAKVKK